MTLYVTQPKYLPGSLCTVYQELCVWTEPTLLGVHSGVFAPIVPKVVTRLFEGDVFLVIATATGPEPGHNGANWCMIVFDERIGWVPSGYISGV